MATPESKVKNACKLVLNKYGAYWFMPPANGYGRAGIPDIVGCYKGLFFGIECKAGYNKPTALQEREMENIRKADGTTFVIREDTVGLLEDWLKGLT